MKLKNYQQQTLETLSKFLTEAKIIGNAAAFTQNQNAPSYSHKYFELKNLEDAPYICLRLPTGGGKTLLGACSIKLATENFLEQDYPLVLWLVPTDTIRQQTLKLLHDSKNFYRQVLEETFREAIRIFDITEFRQLRPQDLKQTLNIFVATFQSFRVTNKDGRKVYQSNENLEACFRDISKQNYFEVGEDGGYNSFGNLISYLRPLMIIDEAHNYSSPLSLEIMQKLRPAAVIELTATPAQNSNVLFQASASELKTEEMIKLPIILTEEFSWETTIDLAVQKRTALETLAAREAEYIRPIALFQAENKDREVTVEVVKKYLIEGAKVPEEQIAVATGERRELDGVNLFSRDCPIRYVITVQALKEGWDCPFAYVFCSLAKIHSSKDAEQLLGRVLRMPYAAQRKSPELNKAYAFVAVAEWMAAAKNIRDDLLNMGFENSEAACELIQPQLFDSAKSIKIQTEEKPQLDRLNLILQGAAVVEKTSGGYELVLENLSAKDLAELETNANNIFKDENARAEFLKAIKQENFKPLQKNSPALRGEKFEMPMLCLDFGDGAEVAETGFFLPAEWKLTGNYDTDLPNFRNDIETKSYEFDVLGHKVKEKYLGDEAKNLFYGETNWTIEELIGWFAKKIQTIDLIFEDLAEFIRRILKRLSDEQKISLEELVRLRFTLLKLLTEKIKICRAAAYKKGWEQILFDNENIACVKPNVTKIFNPEYYPAKSFYSGSVQFEKHFYSTIGDMNKEEIFCAQLIDANEKVATWIRNIEREPLYSFWLPTYADKFYPDFVIKLTDGTYAAIEYKGEHLATSEDTASKKLVGELWQKNNGGKFLLATQRDDKGRTLETQLKEFF